MTVYPKLHRFITRNDGELRFGKGDKIVILESPNTPVAWMHGEVTEKRRGIFPARYVQELSSSDVKDQSDNNRTSENSEATDSNSESSVLVTALKSYVALLLKPSDLALSPGDKVTILNAPGTPVGWMYGEIVKQRRGIFPAQYVSIDKD
ncbi:hypothetical protein FRC00_007645 [Tulasnella sp. 408]|nr:hypothetical protein FRC00_007645 [Tulasnella sp. 408]